MKTLIVTALFTLGMAAMTGYTSGHDATMSKYSSGKCSTGKTAKSQAAKCQASGKCGK